MTTTVAARLAITAAFIAAISITASTQAPRVDVKLASGHGAWNVATADIDGDGERELILSTLDGAKFNVLTFKTPLYILSVIGNKVVDRSSELFEEPVLSWNTTLTTGDFDANGQADLLLCDRGRNVGPNPPPGNVLEDGTRGALNQVFLNRDGKLRKTDGFPNVVTSSWGCSAGDVDRSRRDTITIPTFYAGKGVDRDFQLTWDGASRFIQTRTLTGVPNSQFGWGVSATADFDGNGYADVSGAQQVLWNGAGGAFTGVQPLAPSGIEKEGFMFYRTAMQADFTGDGLPDLVKVNNFGEPTAGGPPAPVAYAMYRGDRRLGLIEQTDAFPASATYNFAFSQQTVAIDLNFDGALDIASQGATYGSTTVQPTAVWLNDGSGRFHQASWSDPLQANVPCTASEVYFLKTNDPKKYQMIYGGCGSGYVGRAVTESRPLTLTP